VSSVAITDNLSDFVYAGAPTVGPDGTFLPSGTWRCPDLTGTFTNIHNFNIPDGTPGTANDCDDDPPPSETPPAPVTVFIHDVQGAGNSVAITNPVTVEAVVVGDYQEDDQLDGFFIQEEDAHADANPATSEGIFVYCGSNN